MAATQPTSNLTIIKIFLAIRFAKKTPLMNDLPLVGLNQTARVATVQAAITKKRTGRRAIPVSGLAWTRIDRGRPRSQFAAGSDGRETSSQPETEPRSWPAAKHQRSYPACR